MACHRNSTIFFTTVILILFIFTISSSSASTYRRPPRRSTLYVTRRDQSPIAAQQVHISMVLDKMRVMWISDRETSAIVNYGTSQNSLTLSATGSSSSYSYTVFYTSGYIYDVVIGPLKPNTVYYYTCGLDSRVLSFKTAPAQFPIKFAVVGDLGQTEWTNSTLQHIAKSDYDILLLPGDLSYADTFQSLWDSFGELVEPLASQRPWMVTQGNHEVESILVVHSEPFTSYNARWHMPFEQSGSESNLYYSFDVSGVHVIMLGSYTEFDPSSAQYKWLEADLGRVDRSKLKWVLVNVHAPWYNSNEAHQDEDESVEMRKYMEDLLFRGRVDVVFAGHVHAYERFTRVYNGQGNGCAPVYIVVGDGGNREGLASKYMDPQPEISLFREASFGHGEFEVMNETHALWTWHRNQDDESVVADSAWLTSLSSNPACAKP